MQRSIQPPKYVDKVKGVLFTNVEDLFQREEQEPVAKASVPNPTEKSEQACKPRAKAEVGASKRTFLREVRLSQESSIKQKASRDKNSFWKSIIKKSSVSGAASGCKEKTNLTVEIGGWINLPYDIHTTLFLVIEYFDGETNCSFKVDCCESKGAIQVLLSGTCDVIADCQVDTVRLYCYGIDDKSVWIENLTFECRE